MKNFLFAMILAVLPAFAVEAQEPVPMNAALNGPFVDNYYVTTRYATAPTSTYPVPLPGNYSYWGFGTTWAYYPYWNYSPYYTVPVYYGTGGYGFGYYAPYYTAYYPWSNPYYFYAYPYGVYYPYYGAFPSAYYSWAYPYYPGSYFYYNYSPIYSYGYGFYGADASQPRDTVARLNAAPITPQGIADAMQAEQPAIKTVAFAKETKVTEVDTAAAETYYAMGNEQFWAGEHESALKHFTNAAANDPEDARYWYFKGMCEVMLASPTAEVSLGRAVELDSQNGRNPDVAQALERIQGSFRLKLEETLRQAKLQR